MKKTLSIILCIAMLVSSISVCFPAFAVDVDFAVETAKDLAESVPEADLSADTVSPISATGYDGKTEDVNPLYPGAYYTFDTEIDAKTLEDIGNSAVKFAEYDAATKTVILYPDPKTVLPGAELGFDAFSSSVKTVGGDTVDFPAVKYTLSENVNTGANLTPYGDGHSAYPGAYADSSYKIVVEGGKLFSKTSRTATNPAFAYINIPFTAGSTYRVYVTLRVQEAIKNGPAVKVVPTWYFKGDAVGINTNADGVSHVLNSISVDSADTTKEYKQTFETTIASVDPTAQMALRFHTTTPVRVSGKTVAPPSYYLSDIRAYQRLDVAYGAGDYCALISGEDELDRVQGVFLDGTAGSTEVKISETVPYEVTDNRWYIDEDKPWIDQDGVEYAAGEIVDLAVANKTLNLVPNVKTDLNVYTLTFAHDNIIDFPNNLQVFEGETVDLTAYNKCKSTVAYKRFGGWEDADGNILTSITMAKDSTVYPHISYDYDFAYEDSYNGTYISSVANEDAFYYEDSMITSVNRASADTFIVLGNLEIPTTTYKGMKIWFDAYSKTETAEKFVPELASSMEGLYLNTTKAVDATKYINGSNLSGKLVTENGKKYLVVTIDGYKDSDWAGTLHFMRFDPYNGDPDWAVRRVEFIPYEKFSENVVQISGLDSIETGDLAPVPTVTNGIADIKSVEWKPALLQGNIIDANTVYTVNVTLAPKAGSGMIFADGTTVRSAGGTIPSTLKDNTAITFSITYPETAGVLTHTVTFHDGVGTTAPAFDGKPFPVISYLDLGADLEAPLPGTRFLGWATEPGKEHVFDGAEYLNVTEDIELYPIFGYGYNFAINNHAPNEAGYSYERLFLGKYLKVETNGKDANLGFSTKIPVYLIKNLKVYYDPEYYVANPDTIYYRTATDSVLNEDKAIRSTSTRGIDPATGYYYIQFNPSLTSSYTGTITWLRYDVFLNTFKGNPAYVRAIDFEYNEIIDADTVHFAGIPSPVAGMEDTTASKIQIGDSYATFDHVEWTPALNMNQTTVGRFDENETYTATVYFKPVQGGRFHTEGMKIYNSATDETVDADFDAVTGCISATFDAGSTAAYNDFTMELIGEEYFLIDGKEHTYKVKINGNPLDKRFAVLFTAKEGNVLDYADCYTDATGNPVIKVRKPCTIAIAVISAYNADVYDTIEVTTECIEFTAEIAGPDSIGKASRLTQYKMNTISELPIYDTTATWSVDDESIATIDAKTGKLVPSANGTVTITAVSNYDPTVSASKTVEITNQATAGTIVYHEGTQDAASVSNMPAPQTAYGTVELSDVIPVRDGFSFLGWATSDESFNTVGEVTVQAEAVVDVYAVWAKGIFYDFNGSKTGVSGFSVGGKNEVQTDTYWSYQTAANDTRFTMNVNIDPKKYRVVQIRMATDASEGSSKIYYKGTKDGVTYGFDTNNYANAENMSLTVPSGGKGIDTWETINFDFYNSACGSTPAKWSQGSADSIIRMDFQLSQARPGSEVRIDYIAILDSSVSVAYNKNTEDAVEGMPEDAVLGQGDKLTISETPVREGYKFMGWSKDPEDRSNMKTEFTVVGDITLYAMWDKSVVPSNDEEDDMTVSNIGSIDPSTDGEALLVGTNAGKGAKVTLTYTDDDGATQTLTATTNANGYVVFDLEEIDGKATDAKVSVNNNYRFNEVTVTDAKTADKKANYVEQKISGGGGSYTPPSSNVTDVKSDKDYYDPSTMYSDGKDGGEPYVDPLTQSKEAGDILYNFNNEKNSDLFNSYRQVSMNGVSESVLHLTSNGLKSGSNDSPAFTTTTLAVDADTHKYIVVKAKQSGLSNKALRIYFQEEGGKFAEAKALSQNLADGYSMLVYDMSQFAEWTGKITRFMFSFSGDVKGDCDIDWILFTNEVPADIDDIDGTHEMFPDVVSGEFPFVDVKAADWFYGEVNNAYRKGFVKGMTETTYEPDGNVTIAEAITMAVRINYAFNEKEDDIKLGEGDKWYTNYVNAAVKAGIIKNTQFADYDKPALRKEVAAIMYKAVPSTYLTSINMFTSIPDCDKKDSSYSAILKLYNAGIVQGSDAEYNFYPDTNITRAEMAAILNRIALPQNRKRIVTEAEKEAKKIKIYADDIVNSGTLGNCEGSKLVIKNGAAWAMAKTKDPIVYLTNLMPNLNGKDVKAIHVGLKWDASKIANPTSAGCRIFFTTPAGSWAESRSLKSAWDGKLDASGVADIVFDATANAEFANTITAIRFDPFDSINEFSIAYVIVE